jgi:hypothetical protein
VDDASGSGADTANAVKVGDDDADKINATNATHVIDDAGLVGGDWDIPVVGISPGQTILTVIWKSNSCHLDASLELCYALLRRCPRLMQYVPPLLRSLLTSIMNELHTRKGRKHMTLLRDKLMIFMYKNRETLGVTWQTEAGFQSYMRNIHTFFPFGTERARKRSDKLNIAHLEDANIFPARLTQRPPLCGGCQELENTSIVATPKMIIDESLLANCSCGSGKCKHNTVAKNIEHQRRAHRGAGGAGGQDGEYDIESKTTWDPWEVYTSTDSNIQERLECKGYKGKECTKRVGVVENGPIQIKRFFSNLLDKAPEFIILQWDIEGPNAVVGGVCLTETCYLSTRLIHDKATKDHNFIEYELILVVHHVCNFSHFVVSQKLDDGQWYYMDGMTQEPGCPMMKKPKTRLACGVVYHKVPPDAKDSKGNIKAVRHRK